MDDRERRVREEAYRLWDEAGRPEGRGESHWHEAEKNVAAAERAASPARAKKPKGVKPIVKGAGASGVAVPIANDEVRPRPTKGAAVEVGIGKPKKPKAAGGEKPVKAEKPKGAKNPGKAGKPKSKP